MTFLFLEPPDNSAFLFNSPISGSLFILNIDIELQRCAKNIFTISSLSCPLPCFSNVFDLMDQKPGFVSVFVECGK